MTDRQLPTNNLSSENKGKLPVMIEYIWLGADQSIRSKSRTVYIGEENEITLERVPKWNYDGSSTGQAPGDSSEVTLEPIAMFSDPFRGGENKLVFCEGTRPDEKVKGFNRKKALKIFKDREDEEMWFGIEQEYVLYDGYAGGQDRWHRTKISESQRPVGHTENMEPQGQYYCGVGSQNVVGREIMEEHYNKCLEAGLTISGTNAEVMLGQWEYQVGPCLGIQSGDQLWMSRYILERVCEDAGVIVSWHPKPVAGDWNGSGCHTNFSTKTMREKGTKEVFDNAIDNLRKNHQKHIDAYGEDNDMRLTGEHETASIHEFSSGVGNRGASIRIPSSVHENNYKSGYLEDRRPSSNCDPYVVTSLIAKTILPNN
jgi:glutamine synthetase